MPLLPLATSRAVKHGKGSVAFLARGAMLNENYICGSWSGVAVAVCVVCGGRLKGML